MARFTLDDERLNFTVEQRGKEYNLRLLRRAQVIFSGLLNLLPSNYISAIQGPSYTLELKAVAVELARIELALEDVDLDRDFNRTRPEFLYSIIGYLVFLNGKIPPLEFDDVAFRSFLLSLIRIYFQGSISKSIYEATDLFLTSDFEVLENFLLTRTGVSGLDISDQFGFQINVKVTDVLPPEIFEIEASLRTILNIIRPAHTLFQLRYIFEDAYTPNDPEGRVLDEYRWRMASYYYEDFRSYWDGIRDRDRLGKKENCTITGESHSADF
jgi:hypothetical protein